MNPLVIVGLAIGLLFVMIVLPGTLQNLKPDEMDETVVDMHESDQGIPMRTGEQAIAELQARGLWAPSVPISERPEDMTKLRTEGGMLVQP